MAAVSPLLSAFGAQVVRGELELSSQRRAVSTDSILAHSRRGVSPRRELGSFGGSHFVDERAQEALVHQPFAARLAHGRSAGLSRFGAASSP